VGVLLMLVYLVIGLVWVATETYGNLPVRGLAVAVGLAVAWRVLISGRVVATSEGVRLVRAFWVPTRLRWVEIDRFEWDVHRVVPFWLWGYVVVKDSQRKLRLPGFSAGALYCDRRYVRASITALSRAHASALETAGSGDSSSVAPPRPEG